MTVWVYLCQIIIPRLGPRLCQIIYYASPYFVLLLLAYYYQLSCDLITINNWKTSKAIEFALLRSGGSDAQWRDTVTVTDSDTVTQSVIGSPWDSRDTERVWVSDCHSLRQWDWVRVKWVWLSDRRRDRVETVSRVITSWKLQNAWIKTLNYSQPTCSKPSFCHLGILPPQSWFYSSRLIIFLDVFISVYFSGQLTERKWPWPSEWSSINSDFHEVELAISALMLLLFIHQVAGKSNTPK